MLYTVSMQASLCPVIDWDRTFFCVCIGEGGGGGCNVF